MLLLEVYVQGVSRFLTSFKFPLTKGYNAVYGSNDSGKSALAFALAATFDPQFAAQAAARLAPLIPQDTPARYGALFEHKGERYRLLRDVGGGVNLARFNAATQKFDTIARDEGNVANFLQDELDFPLNGSHAVLGFVDRTPPGSTGGTSAAPPAESSYASSYDYGDEAPADEPAPDIEAQIKQLKRELHVLGSVDDLEFRADGLQKKKFETEAALAKYRGFDARLEAIAKRTEIIKPIQALTPDYETRVKNFAKQEEYQRQKLGALDGDIRILERELDVLEPKSQRRFQKDPFFIGGAGVALVGFLLPFFAQEFLVIFGFAGAGWLVYLYFLVYPKTMSRLDEISRKHKIKVAEEEKLKKDFDTATAVVKDLVIKLKVLDAKDLLEISAEWRKMREEEVEIQREREELAKNRGDFAKLQKEYERQEAEIALFEEELRNAGAITRDANQIRAELARLEALQNSGPPSGPAPTASSFATPVAAAAAPAGVAAVSGFNVSTLLSSAANTARLDLEDILVTATEKLNTYLRAFTNGKLGSPELGADGSFTVVRNDAGGQRVGVGQLSEGSRDTVVAALRLGLLEAVLPHRPFPVILDDPFALLDDQRQVVAAKAVKRIAALTQVIHFTPQKSFLAVADNKVELQ